MKQLLMIALGCSFFYCGNAQTETVKDYLKKGEEALSRSQVLPAYQYYKLAVEKDAANPDALKGMARTADELRYVVVARETYKKLLDITPRDTAALGRLVQLNFATRQYQETIDLGKQVEAMGAGSNNNYYIAKSFFELGQFQSALMYIEKSWKKDSSQAELPFLAARSYIELNDYRKATVAYEKALRLAPSNVSWMYEAAMTYSAIPDEAKAVLWFEKALAGGLEMTPDVARSLAESYMGVQSYGKALQLLNELLEQLPRDLELLYIAGEANFRSGKTDEAISTFEKMLAIDRNQARAVYMIGIALIKKGDRSKGEPMCEKAIAMDPSLASLKHKQNSLRQ
ncbi:tetratricopeptide repeat protein [Flavihumibacter solisilvae]|uniref:Tetratricopeptide repeat protein n=1 Tax=Flavihumibacter solisilvae TaxID=1349421 RepID=A0A0C1LEI5_9BACT|nr:tetratricopeptide repeat protein [Flavihumibacter solisilvae]KIC93823.1 hypothetical protein OI18_14580 [Flavihumibacter solisilvae]